VIYSVLEPSPCIFERLRIWPFNTVRSVGKAQIGFKRSDILPVGTPKGRLSHRTLDNRHFGGVKFVIARKGRGSVRVQVYSVCTGIWSFAVHGFRCRV
jgi:hypothetical protein